MLTARQNAAGVQRTDGDVTSGEGASDVRRVRSGRAGRPARDLLVEVARQDAQAADERRRLGPQVAAALVDAGFPRHFVPVRWGGTAGTFTQLLADASAVAEACAAAG